MITMSAFHSFLFAFSVVLLTTKTGGTTGSDLVDSIAWSIGHEGCPVYQVDPTSGRADVFLAAEELRKCFLDSQKDNKEVLHLLLGATDNELVQATKDAVQVAKRKYSVKENLGWVLFHEGQLAYFQSLAKAGKFAAIRSRYRQLQGHNPDAINALSSLTDSELASALELERVSVFLKTKGNPDPLTLTTIASYTEPTSTKLTLTTTLGDLANRIYGSSAPAYLKVIAYNNPNLLQPDADGLQVLPSGVTLNVPSVPVPGKAESLPLKTGVSALAMENFLASPPAAAFRSEVPKQGKIETPVKAALQSTTVANVASEGLQWYLQSISADKVRRGDLGFLSPPVVAVVGVVDGGVAENHPLIKPVLWSLPPELASPSWPSGSVGYDFFLDSPNPVEQLDNSHGTHVTGLVTGRQLATWLPFFDDAGLSNNVEAFSLKVAGPDGTFDFTFAQNAIEAGISKGIRLYNLSLSGPKSGLLNKDLSQDERINNTLFVVAAGNADAGNPRIDLDADKSQLATFRKDDGTGLENFIFVAALADTGKLADFSNYGKSLVQIAAPGVEISSTIYPDTFGTLSGTSQAAPLVTLTAAILKAEKPDMVPLALKHRILNTCDWEQSLTDSVEYGCRLNLAKAIVCGSDLLELSKDGSYVRGDIDRAQFFPGMPVDASLVRVRIEDSNSALYAYASGKREPRSLHDVNQINVKLHEGEECPNAVQSGVCSISVSEVKDIVFRLR
jgi:Subtilase family